MLVINENHQNCNSFNKVKKFLSLYDIIYHLLQQLNYAIKNIVSYHLLHQFNYIS